MLFQVFLGLRSFCVFHGAESFSVLVSGPRVFFKGLPGFQILGFSGFRGLGFRVWGLGFRVCGLGFRVFGVSRFRV